MNSDSVFRKVILHNKVKSDNFDFIKNILESLRKEGFDEKWAYLYIITFPEVSSEYDEKSAIKERNYIRSYLHSIGVINA